MKEENQKRIFNAGKKAQEIDDMQLLGAIIKTHLNGEVHINQHDLLREYWVSRETDLKTGNLVLKAISE